MKASGGRKNTAAQALLETVSHMPQAQQAGLKHANGMAHLLKRRVPDFPLTSMPACLLLHSCDATAARRASGGGGREAARRPSCEQAACFLSVFFQRCC